MAPTILALLLPLSLSLGCGGGNDPVPPPGPPPALSGDAALSGLSLSFGELSPPFDAAVGNYAVGPVGHLGEDSIGVTVTLRSAKASFRVNGLAGASGQASNIALTEGANTIQVAVTAEDGVGHSLVTLTVNRLPFNTRVWVLNGMGGVPVENTVLTLTDAGGAVIADNVPLPKAKNGQPVFGLDPGQKYNIYAKGDNVATACYANYDPAKEDTATLYCLRNYTTFYELEAPLIEDISFATSNAANADWKTMDRGAYYVGPLAGVAAVRVTALTRNLISVGFGDQAAEHDPIRINIDETASANTGGATGATGAATETNVPVNRGGRTYYRTTHRFAMPGILNTSVFNKQHYLSVVAYDMIGNRTEQRVYMTITDSASNHLTDADLTGVTPTWDYMQSVVYMGGGDLPVGPGYEVNAMDPVDPYTAYQENTMQFFVRSAGTDAPIRGFEVWRTNGGAGFAKIATVNFAAATAAAPFVYRDRTPSLVEGDVQYMIRAFSGNPLNNGYSQFSAPKRGRIMPPTTTGPAASHRQVSNALWPEFRIAASNPKMFNSDTTDRFVFTLFVRSAANPYPFLMVPFRLLFTETHLIGTDPNSAENQHRFGFPVGRPTAHCLLVTDYNGATSTIGDGTWYYASSPQTVDGETTYTPFVYLDDDGSVVVNTDSPGFRTIMQNAVRSYYSDAVEPPQFRPGVTYLWNLFGNNGGVFWNGGYPARWTTAYAVNAAYFIKDFNDAPYATAYLGVSIGSNMAWGLGSPDGWFTLIIDPDAK
jgi:hypothetical protein